MNNRYVINTTSVIFIMAGLFCDSMAFAGNNASLSTNAVITPKQCNFSINQSQFNFPNISMEKPDLYGNLNQHQFFNITASDGCAGAYLTAESTRYSGENNTIALPSDQEEDNIGLGVSVKLTRYSDAGSEYNQNISFDGTSRFEFLSPAAFHYEGGLAVVPSNNKTLAHGPNPGQINTNIMFTVNYG